MSFSCASFSGRNPIVSRSRSFFGMAQPCTIPEVFPECKPPAGIALCVGLLTVSLPCVRFALRYPVNCLTTSADGCKHEVQRSSGGESDRHAHRSAGTAGGKMAAGKSAGAASATGRGWPETGLGQVRRETPRALGRGAREGAGGSRPRADIEELDRLCCELDDFQRQAVITRREWGALFGARPGLVTSAPFPRATSLAGPGARVVNPNAEVPAAFPK